MTMIARECIHYRSFWRPGFSQSRKVYSSVSQLTGSALAFVRDTILYLSQYHLKGYLTEELLSKTNLILKVFFEGHYSVIGVYVNGLQNTRPDFYHYLPL